MLQPFLLAAALAGAAPALAQHADSSVAHVDTPRVPDHNKPDALLIGTWDVAPVGGPPQAITTLRWGPGNSYLWLATSVLVDGKPVPRFEGVLVWNGVRRRLDMLLSPKLGATRPTLPALSSR